MKKVNKKTYIIAEAGVNHNGSLQIAKKLIKAAKLAGADAVKFQAYVADEMVSNELATANYQKKNTKIKNQYNLLKKYELSFSNLKELKKYADILNIDYLLSVFDETSLQNVKNLKLKNIKIPSGEITNYLLLKKVKNFNNIIISTGASNQTDVSKTLNFLIKSGVKKKKITLLQCNTSYPSPDQDANLNVIKNFKEKFNIKVGYSDHTQNILAPSIAVALGAVLIEKHITLNKRMKGPDHFASFDFSMFKKMTELIRNTEILLGNKTKKITRSEKGNINFIRKFLVSKAIIEKNEKFSLKNLKSQRTGKGISAEKILTVLGKKSKKKYFKNQII